MVGIEHSEEFQSGEGITHAGLGRKVHFDIDM
jgi:hypothetical protein